MRNSKTELVLHPNHNISKCLVLEEAQKNIQRQYMQESILTIGILAHVDAGKTSLTEAMLFESGALTHAGSVDKGSAITDSMKMEKDRGISIRSATVDFTWKNTFVNIVYYE